MTVNAPPDNAPEVTTFIGRDGTVLPAGVDQYPFYGYRNGHDGSGVVTTHQALLKQTKGSRDSCGRGFDTEAEALVWVDSFVIAEYPRKLDMMKAKWVGMESQLQAARRRATM
ncbi:unnamed protein product [Peniophora sp. CBMAI 1063]|nr:unnamed protein product [Peniophora sp. CBMAI 1063]